MLRQTRATPPPKSRCRTFLRTPPSHFPVSLTAGRGQGGGGCRGGLVEGIAALLGSENRSRYRGGSQLQSHQSRYTVQLRVCSLELDVHHGVCQSTIPVVLISWTGNLKMARVSQISGSLPRGLISVAEIEGFALLVGGMQRHGYNVHPDLAWLPDRSRSAAWSYSFCYGR